MAHILKMFRMPDGNITAIIQGRKRFDLGKIVQSDPFFKANVTELIESKPNSSDNEFESLS